jgi:hypothetical protein
MVYTQRRFESTTYIYAIPFRVTSLVSRPVLHIYQQHLLAKRHYGFL